MHVGKLLPDVLERLLAQVPITDPRVLLGGRIGEDAALIDMGDRVLVVKTDPITFATDLIGWYAVQINANDVATMGAQPRWFLSTILLPEEAQPSLAEAIFSQVVAACQELSISLIGGHTEVTHQLQRPIVVGLMLGEVDRDRVVLTSGARPGDAILLTKGIAIEGTAVLAREATAALAASKVPEGVIARAREYLFNPGISVVKEALMACDMVTVHSMHDPTEGGLVTGLREIAQAAGVGMTVDGEAVRLLPECREVCSALGVDPLGLLASGALIITLPADQAQVLTKALAKQRVEAHVIGRVGAQEEGVTLRNAHGVGPMPAFPRDELARYLDESSISQGG